MKSQNKNQENQDDFAIGHLVFVSPIKICKDLTDVLAFDLSRSEKVRKELTRIKNKGYTQYHIQYIPVIEHDRTGAIHVIIVAWK